MAGNRGCGCAPLVCTLQPGRVQPLAEAEYINSFLAGRRGVAAATLQLRGTTDSMLP